MVLVCESRSEPSLSIIRHRENATPTQKVTYREAFVCRCVVVAKHVCTRSCRLGTFHCTQFHLGSAAFRFKFIKE